MDRLAKRLMKIANDIVADKHSTFTAWGLGKDKKKSIQRFVNHIHSIEHEMENAIIVGDYSDLIASKGIDYAFDSLLDDICGWGYETTPIADALDAEFGLERDEMEEFCPSEIKPYMEYDSGLECMVFDVEKWLRDIFERVVNN